jgi:serine/threonine-protein kinase
MIAGSPIYMSPEQSVAGQELDGRSDLYALGAVAYFLLTERPPFAGRTAVELIVAHARDPVTPPSQLNAAVPPDLEAIILRCLMKDREKRFPTADSLEQALSSCALSGHWTQQQAAVWWHNCAGARRSPNLPTPIAST